MSDEISEDIVLDEEQEINEGKHRRCIGVASELDTKSCIYFYNLTKFRAKHNNTI